MANGNGAADCPRCRYHRFSRPGEVAILAGGGTVEVTEKNGQRVFTLNLDVADALILR